VAGCYRYRAAGLRRDETSVQGISSAGPGKGIPSGIFAHRQAINRGPGMPVFGTFHRRRGGFSRTSRRAVRLRPPRNLQYSDAGSRWAYRGRPAHPYAQSARDTPRQHSLGSRDRCPVCAPGAAYAPDLLNLVLLAPRKDGAAAGGIPLPGASFADCLAPN